MLASLIEVTIDMLIAKVRQNKLNKVEGEDHLDKEDKQSYLQSTNVSEQNSNEDDVSNVEKKYLEYFSNNWSDVIHRDDGWRSRTEIVDRDKRLMNHIYADDSTIVRCKPMFTRNKHNGFRFPKFNVPKEVTETVYDDKDPKTAFPIITEKLTPRNYANKFHFLLYFEEAAMYLEMRNFDMDLQVLNRCGEYMALEVPKSLSKHNALVGGNRVLLTDPSSVPKITFEGFIHKIKGNFILIRFHDDFHRMYDGTAYNVSFHSGRTYFRQGHYAIDLIHSNLCQEVLFPSDKKLLKRQNLWKGEVNKLCFFNTDLNSDQKNAVIGVLRSPQRPAPYIIVGPKNSGKTTVLIECILQIVSKIRRSRIIVCINSNVAADFVAIKLLESKVIHEDKLTRLVSFNYSRYTDERLKPLSVVFKDDPFDKDWLYRKVIVTTCNNAGNIYSMLKSFNHFTHCFIDDSTKATEPEALVAIGLVAPGLGVTVLTGDVAHIKPYCESIVMRENGLNEPLLTRLMQMDVYRPSQMYHRHGGYNPYYITKLEEIFKEH